ncbi:ParB/RepB/Spo0J family partition protein [Ectothiorhodospiraceae bacterium 2226]|nr:ParB/RepB/Spo0J family partition protein [Ectothiorhodospiraceae bacterium 2226]
MAVKKRGLGRGLETLLGGSAPTRAEDRAREDGDLRHLGVDLIQRGKYQPRLDMRTEALEELAASIRAQGVVQPIVVRPLPERPGRYEIIAGERRWRAAQMAGLHEIPAVVRDVPDRVAIAMALIENIQREGLNAMEEARALQRLVDEFEMTHQIAADAVGRSRVAVSNLLRLLTLNEDVQTRVEQGELEMGHARALLALSGELQSRAARMAVERKLSVRQTEALVRQLAQNPDGANKPMAPRVDPDIRRLQEQLSERLGAKVVFQHGPKGRGKVVIQYNSLEELDGILDHIK